MNEKIEGLIVRRKLIVIVRRLYGEPLMKLAEALYEGGVRLMEVTFDQCEEHCAAITASAISGLKERLPGLSVGAGTVLSPAQVRTARDAGAKFIISPNTDADVISETLRQGLVSIPGAMTPSEMMQAHLLGAHFIKLFPAAWLGLEYLKAVRAPLGHLKLIATAGITLDNYEEWLHSGCVAAGVSGVLTDHALVAAKNWSELKKRAESFAAIAERCHS